MELIRSLVEAIILVPEGSKLRVEVRGELAAILALSAVGSPVRMTGIQPSKIKMVAGARNYLNLLFNALRLKHHYGGTGYR